MALKEKLHQTPEYQAATGNSPGQGQAQETAQRQGRTQGQPQIPGEIQPILSLEKGDMEFWLRVATVVLLYMILQELKRGRP